MWGRSSATSLHCECLGGQLVVVQEGDESEWIQREG